ncbi:Hypothetical predicted protein [Lecanosticta acicola]|uniref:GA4 desaturase n=1 Tax=Lecanosticta acicola TaxID=111012 RepID=A0AAI9ECL6_9PEZI|nr:Hypothetical predicted protein [Lecanosticta acicola]
MAAAISNLIDNLCAFDDEDNMATTAVQLETETTPVPVRPSRAVDTHLYYFPDDQIIKDLYLGTASMHLMKFKPVPTAIHDVRSSEEDFTLDKNGFQYVKQKPSVKDLKGNDDERIKKVVYAETEELVKAITGATHVVITSHLVRMSSLKDVTEAAEMAEDEMKVLPPGPATHIHVDQSYESSVQFLKDALTPEEAAQLQKTRWGIINVWRPISRAVTRDALAVCDWNSLSLSQLQPVMVHLPTSDGKSSNEIQHSRSFESWRLKHAGEENKWYFCSNMTPDEALLIKSFDSKLDGRARLAPLTSFESRYDKGPARWSLEMRCLVFWEDQEAE